MLCLALNLSAPQPFDILLYALLSILFANDIVNVLEGTLGCEQLYSIMC